MNSYSTELEIRYNHSFTGFSGCAGYIITGGSNSCCMSLLPADVSDDCMVTVFDAESVYYYTVNTNNVISINSLSNWQRKQMDLNLNYLQSSNNICQQPTYSQPCPTSALDITYLLKIVLKLFFFVLFLYIFIFVLFF